MANDLSKLAYRTWLVHLLWTGLFLFPSYLAIRQVDAQSSTTEPIQTVVWTFDTTFDGSPTPTSTATPTATSSPTTPPHTPTATPRPPLGAAANEILLPLVAQNAGPPSVRFLTPTSGATVTETFSVEMAATNLTIRPAGNVVPGTGHFHIMVDAACVVPGRPIPEDEKHLHLDDGHSTTRLALTPGEHTLCLQAGDGIHTALPALDIIAIHVAAIGPGGIYTTSVAPDSDDDFAKADFTLWLPENVPVVRGVLIDAPDCFNSTLFDVFPEQARVDFARTWHFGYLGMKFMEKPSTPCILTEAAASGSVDAIITALAQLGQETGRPELAQSPWVIFGWSGGAIWGMETAITQPARTIAVFARGSGSDDGRAANAYPVPIVMSTGEHDIWAIGLRSRFYKHRPSGALWTLALTKNDSHLLGKAWQMALPFFDAVITQRLPAPPPPGDVVTLAAMDASKAWLGNNDSIIAAPIGDYPDNKATASWLPDEPTAKLWEVYVLTGFESLD